MLQLGRPADYRSPSHNLQAKYRIAAHKIALDENLVYRYGGFY